MKFGKLVITLLSATLVSSVLPLSGHASTKVSSYENIKNATYTVTNAKATVYSSASLKHKKGTLGSYGSKVTGYYAAHVKKNNHASIYYKFKVGNKTGWVWHGYLKQAKPAEKFNEAAIDARFVELINQHRAEAGAQPVTIDSNLFQKVTLLRASQLITRYSHTDEAGNFIAADMADAAGINYWTFSENIAIDNWEGTNKATADEIFNMYFYHDADSNWGHRDNILNGETTNAAVATVYKDGQVYNVMNFYSTPANQSFPQDSSTESF